MRAYRFYAIGKDGHIDEPPITHDLADDRAAVSEARRLLHGCDIEIWQDQRLVAYVVPDDQTGNWPKAG